MQGPQPGAAPQATGGRGGKGRHSRDHVSLSSRSVAHEAFLDVRSRGAGAPSGRGGGSALPAAAAARACSGRQRWHLHVSALQGLAGEGRGALVGGSAGVCRLLFRRSEGSLTRVCGHFTARGRQRQCRRPGYWVSRRHRGRRQGRLPPGELSNAAAGVIIASGDCTTCGVAVWGKVFWQGWSQYSCQDCCNCLLLPCHGSARLLLMLFVPDKPLPHPFPSCLSAADGRGCCWCHLCPKRTSIW